ncbi:MAG TPA: hydroxypyruvate isomerase [Polyangia bacterium]|nr:hydroxypyruvate isomerase [Polyangia bacterium]
MPKFCANLTLMFNEVDFLDRFDAAAKAGFKGVEYLFPYVAPAAQVAEKLNAAKLTQVLHNLPAGNWAAGDRGTAVDPARVGEFQDGVGKAIEYAKALGCKQLNALAGLTPKDVPAEKVRETFVNNLRFAAERLAGEGIKLLIEPINTRDIPGFYLTKTQQALDVIAAVGSPNLWLQYDIYHMQVMEGDLAPTIEKNLAKIAHMQLADNPGRHEPGTGEINYEFLFKHIDKLGYQGWIGCEYKPAAATTAGLGWVKPYLT